MAETSARELGKIATSSQYGKPNTAPNRMILVTMYAIDTQVYFKNFENDGIKVVIPLEEWHRSGDPLTLTIFTNLG